MELDAQALAEVLQPRNSRRPQGSRGAAAASQGAPSRGWEVSKAGAAALEDDEEEQEESDEEFDLDLGLDMDMNSLDAEVLSTLPQSVQLEVLKKMKETHVAGGLMHQRVVIAVACVQVDECT